MCLSGAMYLDEDQYEKQKAEEKFYKKQSETWDYYSGLPNPKAQAMLEVTKATAFSFSLLTILTFSF